MRVFLACRIESAVATELAHAIAPWRDRFAGNRFRWVPPDNYHITLRFFGAVTAAASERLADLVAPIAAGHQAITCHAGAPAPLPNSRQPRVLALPIASGNRLEQLAAAANAALAPYFGGAEHAFRAHLTIVRCRRGARIGRFARDEDSAFSFRFEVASLGLYESVLGADGARYIEIEEFAFAMPDGQ